MPSMAQEYAEYMHDKRVVVVGPAASLQGRKQGKLIDSHDVIVRINLDCPVPKEMAEDRGTGTDVLYHVLFSPQVHRNLFDHSLKQVDDWKRDGVKFLLTRQRPGNERLARFQRIVRGAIEPISVPADLLNNLRKRFSGKAPNTGTIAVAHVLSFPVRSVYVTGFTWYEDPYYVGIGGFTPEQAEKGRGGYSAWGQTNRRNTPHPQAAQKAYMVELYRKDARLSFDEVASSILGITKQDPQVTAIVPIKGESERVPRKNMRPLMGKPLLHWTLTALHVAEHVGQVVVDTDSDEIEALVKRHAPRTKILRRPQHLQGGHVTAQPLAEWEMSQVDGEHFLQTHVTNPLLTPETIDKAIETYFSNLKKSDSLFSVTEHHVRLFNEKGEPVNHDPSKLIRSQDLEPLYEDNSNMYLFSRRSFQASGGRIGKRPAMFPMSKLEAIDIDEEDDFAMAEAVMRLTHA